MFKCEDKMCEVCKIENNLNIDWFYILRKEFDKEYYINLKRKLHIIDFIPKSCEIFEFMNFCSFINVKVVFVAQDPFQNRSEACGLTFSARKDAKKLPSCTRTFFKAIAADFGDFDVPNHGNLKYLAEQGVLLMNDTLR
ncbi:ung [Nucleospora cyclopteri]